MWLDYHMHLVETGGLDYDHLRRYVAAACKQGVTEIGFTEHAYMFRQAQGVVTTPWATARCRLDLDDYVQLILDAKREGLPVKLGLEVDYIPGREEQIAQYLAPYPWDYVIGSVHWIGDWGFDLTEQRHRWDEVDVANAYDAYFEQLLRAAQSGLFDVLGHPDVIKVFGYRPQATPLGWYRKLAATLRSADLCAEVSTAGWRKPVNELYPAPAFLEQLLQAGVPVTLASDAHRPEDVGHRFAEAAAILKEQGCRQIARFDARVRTRVAL